MVSTNNLNLVKHNIVVDPFGASKDPKMPFLAHALDPRKVERYIEGIFFSNIGGKGHIRLLRINVVRYKPGRRCLIEYYIEAESTDMPHQVITLLGKARARGVDTATYGLCENLWNMDFHDKSVDRVSVPQPIGMIPEINMCLQRKVTGSLATKLLVKSDGVDLARRIAEAIHKLHQANISNCRQHSMADELRILQERLSMVAEDIPAWKSRIEQVLAACHQLGNSVPEPKTTGIHRDFYPDQVIVDGTRLHLLDFDLYCEGDPGVDIGNFVSHLQEEALRTLGDPHALADREVMLVERFIELSGESRRWSVEVYTTLTLVRHIPISMHFPERRPFTEALLSLCEKRLSAQGAGQK